MNLKIGLIGDYSSSVEAHVAIPKALRIAEDSLGVEVKENWLATDRIEKTNECFSTYNGLWCVPASPYSSEANALYAIRFARENRVPFLGTCGGFQHAVLEYARDVLGYKKAAHAESNSDAEMQIISPLSCSMVGVSGAIKFQKGSRIAGIYKEAEAVEKYHCNYGFNQKWQSLFDDGAMKITGFDRSGEPRVIELENHPFFIATLFQPERSAFENKLHPLIAAFVQAAGDYKLTREKVSDAKIGQ